MGSPDAPHQSRLSRLVQKTGDNWLGGKLLELGMEEAVRLARGLLRRKARELLPVLEATRETHFTTPGGVESEELLRLLAASHRDALLGVLEKNQARDFQLGSFLSDSEKALGAVSNAEANVFTGRVNGLSDPTLRLAFQVLINNRDQLLLVLSYLKDNNLLDLNPKKLALHLPELIQELRDLQSEFIGGKIAHNAGPIGDAYDLLQRTRGED